MRTNLKYTKELLQEHAAKCKSFAGMIRSLGLKESGGNFRHIQKKCRYYETDTSHFTGQGWNKGLTSETNESVQKTAKSHTLSFEERFCENSKANASSPVFKKLVIENGIMYSCEECGNDGTWRGKSISLDLDHKNGISNDNRLCNLRFLCPNCHRQTTTWGKRNKELK